MSLNMSGKLKFKAKKNVFQPSQTLVYFYSNDREGCCTLNEQQQNKKKVRGDRSVIHRQRDTQIHSEKWVTLKNTSLEKNSARREPARHRWPSLAAAAQQESIVSAIPTRTLMLTSSLELFVPFFFSGPTNADGGDSGAATLA